MDESQSLISLTNVVMFAIVRSPQLSFLNDIHYCSRNQQGGPGRGRGGRGRGGPPPPLTKKERRAEKLYVRKR